MEMTTINRTESAGTVEGDEFVRDWEAWHAAHEARLADPRGFLAITNIHWLDQSPRRFPDAPGAWSTGPDGVRVTLEDGEELTVDGSAVGNHHAFGVIPERGSIFAYHADYAIEVAKRGGYDLVRPRHPDNPLRLQFSGTPAFRPDRRWVLGGRYTPFDAPRPTTVGAAVEGLEHVYGAVGRLQFQLDGRELSLTAFPGKADGSLLVLFTDATSGVTTYAANRSLVVSRPEADGSVTLDFNRAVNLPCAYTNLATCPLPPAENRLDVAIEAGEQTPRERTESVITQTAPPPPAGSR
jgi:uncharacterized protein (DUF1684 family)